jgi:hypothetical protein
LLQERNSAIQTPDWRGQPIDRTDREEPKLASLKHCPLLITILVMWTGALAARPLSAQASASPHVDLNDRGTFELYAAGKNIGTEKFEIRSRPDAVEAAGEIHLRVEQDGKTMEMRTYPSLVLDRQLHPLSYTWSQKGAQSSQISVDFRSSPARTRLKTLSGQEEKRDFKLLMDVLVLDDNVLHHFQLVVDRYDQTAGGKQTFQAFIPQEALPGVITVEEAGTGPVTAEGVTLTLRHLVLTTELAHVDLWVDDHARLQVVSVPEAQFQAVRKK